MQKTTSNKLISSVMLCGMVLSFGLSANGVNHSAKAVADSVTEVPSTTVPGLNDLEYGPFTFPKSKIYPGYQMKKDGHYLPGMVMNTSNQIGTFGITSKNLTNAISLDGTSDGTYYIFDKNGNSYVVNKDPLGVSNMSGDSAIYGGYNSDYESVTSKTVDGITFNNLMEYKITKQANNGLMLTAKCRVDNNNIEKTPILDNADKEGVYIDLNKPGNSYSVDKNGDVTLTTDGKTYHFTKNLVTHKAADNTTETTKPVDKSNSHYLDYGVNTVSNIKSIIVNGKAYTPGTSESNCPTIEIPKSGSVDIKLICDYDIHKNPQELLQDDVATAIKNVGGVYISAKLQNALGSCFNQTLVNTPSGTVTVDLGKVDVNKLGSITSFFTSSGTALDAKAPAYPKTSVVKFKQIEAVSSSSSSKAVSSSKSSSSSVKSSSSSIKKVVSSSSSVAKLSSVVKSSSIKSSSVKKSSSSVKSSSSIKKLSSSKLVSSSSLKSSSSSVKSSSSSKESSSKLSSSSKVSSSSVKIVPSSKVSSSSIKSSEVSSKPESSSRIESSSVISSSKAENQVKPTAQSSVTPSTPSTSTVTTTNTTTTTDTTYSPQKAAMLAKTNATKNHAGILTAIGSLIAMITLTFSNLKKKFKN